MALLLFDADDSIRSYATITQVKSEPYCNVFFPFFSLVQTSKTKDSIAPPSCPLRYTSSPPPPFLRPLPLPPPHTPARSPAVCVCTRASRTHYMSSYYADGYHTTMSTFGAVLFASFIRRRCFKLSCLLFLKALVPQSACVGPESKAKTCITLMD